MALPAKFRLLCPKSVEREINGSTFKFYTLRPRTAAAMAPLLTKLAGCVSVLLSGNDRDQGREFEDWEDAQEGAGIRRQKFSPINPDLAKLRTEQRRKAVEEALDALLSDKNRLAVGRLICDSLRDDFPKGGTEEDAQELMDGMDIIVLKDFLAGLATANGALLGDLGKELGRRVRERAADLLGEESKQSAPEQTETAG